MAFAKPTDSNAFITGIIDKDWKHVHRCVPFTGIVLENVKGLQSSHRELSGNQMLAHIEQVQEHAVDGVQVIDKRGFSINTLDNTSSDYGNFLETIILFVKYEVCLKEKLSECNE